MSTIPKIIHFCWFGRNPKPSLVLRCIESWKKYMPGYEIVEWNEDTYDIYKSDFVKEAYEAKKWAFVSDYARFDVIEEYGGIYFDTDVELLKPIPSEILNQKAFTGFESAGKVNPGLVYADVPHGRVTKMILEQYNQLHFSINGKVQILTVNSIVTEILEPYGLRLDNTYQKINGLSIYPSDVFCGYDQDVKEIDIKPVTICVHHYMSSWTKKTWKQRMRDLLKKCFGIEGYRKLLHIYRIIIQRERVSM